jgi:hypothetical protein
MGLSLIIPHMGVFHCPITGISDQHIAEYQVLRDEVTKRIYGFCSTAGFDHFGYVSALNAQFGSRRVFMSSDQ